MEGGRVAGRASDGDVQEGARRGASDTLNSMANLAHTWKSQYRLEDALDLMQTCFHHQQQVLGRDHPDTVSTRSILTEWQNQKDNTDA